MAGRPALALTSGHVHGVEAGQQVTAPLAVSFHLAQPGVAVKVVAEVRPLHVGHYHTIQVPAGVQACVVVLNPGAEADTHTSLAEQRRHPFHTRIPRCSLQRGVPSVLVVALPLKPQFPHLQNGNTVQGRITSRIIAPSTENPGLPRTILSFPSLPNLQTPDCPPKILALVSPPR